ncbi:MAG: protease modulator HflC [Pseudomonadota bacterium]|nr:protease modulator HflC [Pseudomonadota bacterium]
MNSLRSVIIVILGAIAIVAYSSVFIVDEREKALVVRLGEIKRTINEPGLYFKLPFVEDVIPIEDRIVFFESTDKTVQVVDGRRYQVDAITMIRVVDPQRFRETVDASLTRARDRIETRLDAALRQTYGRRTFDAALSQDRPVMMREIRDQVRTEAASLGIDVIDVRIRRTDLMAEVLNDTYARMSAERLAEAAQLRAIGETQSIKVRAEADRESVELVSKSRRESEIVRGEGEGERNKVFADAFARDGEFFSFYRSMQAYAKALTTPGTTLVLKPDSEFFKYLGTRSPQPQAQPPTQQPPQTQPPAQQQPQAQLPTQQ